MNVMKWHSEGGGALRSTLRPAAPMTLRAKQLYKQSVSDKNSACKFEIILEHPSHSIAKTALMMYDAVFLDPDSEH